MWIIALLFVCNTSAIATEPSEETPIYFYYPQHIQSFHTLDMMMNTYLATRGGYEFQSFSSWDTFESHLQAHPRAIILLSYWTYTSIQRQYHLHPVLIGTRQGSPTEKWGLFVMDASILKKKATLTHVVSALAPQHTRNLLHEMFPNDTRQAFQILSVSANIDALMSVGFGLAQAALCSENSVNSLKETNPQFHKKLKRFGDWLDIPHIILATSEPATPEAQTLVTIFQDMTSDPTGNDIVSLFGFDAWTNFAIMTQRE
jgi:hypothetical protein